MPCEFDSASATDMAIINKIFVIWLGNQRR